MAGFTPLRGAAWIEQIFTRSAVARRGGPVRRSKASIAKHASLISAFHAAAARGWRIIEVGNDWHFYDADLPIHRVRGISTTATPIIAI